MLVSLSIYLAMKGSEKILKSERTFFETNRQSDCKFILITTIINGTIFKQE